MCPLLAERPACLDQQGTATVHVGEDPSLQQQSDLHAILDL